MLWASRILARKPPHTVTAQKAFLYLRTYLEHMKQGDAGSFFSSSGVGPVGGPSTPRGCSPGRYHRRPFLGPLSTPPVHFLCPQEWTRPLHPPVDFLRPLRGVPPPSPRERSLSFLSAGLIRALPFLGAARLGLRPPGPAAASALPSRRLRARAPGSAVPAAASPHLLVFQPRTLLGSRPDEPVPSRSALFFSPVPLLCPKTCSFWFSLATQEGPDRHLRACVPAGGTGTQRLAARSHRGAHW